jgi:hypothetical protein
LRAREQSPLNSGAEAGTPADAKLHQLEGALEALLTLVESRGGGGDLTLHHPVLTLARTYIDQAVAAGAAAKHRARLDALLGRIAYQQAAQAPLIDSKTPRLNGVVLPATPVILKRPDSSAGKTSKELRDEARSKGIVAGAMNDRRSGREHRRFKRYSEPALSVTVEGTAYRTIDWSIGGLALTGGQLDLPRGREVRITLAAAALGSAEQASFSDRAIVTRSEPDAGRLYLRFRSTASATLKILEHLSRQRIEPVQAPVAG